MGILPEAAAAPIRAQFELLMPDRCSIVRVTHTQDAQTGGYSDSEATFASGIPCRVDKSGLTPREYAVAGRESAVAEFIIMLSTVAARWPGGVIDVRASDRIVVTGDGAGSYEPIAAGGPVTDEFVRALQANRIT